MIPSLLLKRCWRSLNATMSFSSIECGSVGWQAVFFLLQPMLAGRLLRRRQQQQQHLAALLQRRCLYLAPPFLVEDHEPAAVATARTEGAMAAKLDQGTECSLASERQFAKNTTTVLKIRFLSFQLMHRVLGKRSFFFVKHVNKKFYFKSVRSIDGYCVAFPPTCSSRQLLYHSHAKSSPVS